MSHKKRESFEQEHCFVFKAANLMTYILYTCVNNSIWKEHALGVTRYTRPTGQLTADGSYRTSGR